jgi:catechol-2,3-dioxygenase
MRVLELRLVTNCLSELRDFYEKTMEFPVLAESSESFTLGAGETRLIFEQGNAGQYHIAFNITENQFAEAKRWAEAHVSLVRMPDGEDQIHWKAWNAHALYFFDPAGNIMEFIARHNLPNASAEPFSSRSIRQVSEVGLPVNHVGQAVEKLRSELGIPVFDAGDGEQFTALGDDDGLFIVVKRGRAWFPTTNSLADDYPLGLTLQGVMEKRIKFPELPYQIEVI